MSFWDTNFGYFIGESITFIIMFVVFWKIFGKKLMKRNEERQREYWKKKFKEEAEQQENQEFHQASKPLTQQSFEEWKAEKRKRDQGGFVDLDKLAKLFHWGIA